MHSPTLSAELLAGRGKEGGSFDAIVIGAGPAGAVTARELARRGCSVLLVDKAPFPRSKVCGCCINGAAISTLKRLGLGSALAGGIPLRDVRIGAGRYAARVRVPGGVSLSREVFDAALVAEAVKVGVEFRAGVTAKLEDQEPTHGVRSSIGVLVRGLGAENGAGLCEELITARVVIVASGLTGGDAVPEAGSRIGAGATVPAGMVPSFFENGTIFMATGHGGYVGLVRVEDGRLDVAAAFDVGFVKAQGGLGPAARAVLGEVGWPQVPGLAELSWKGTPALSRHPKIIAGERWFAVGDASGYVEPFTGEGMAWAVMSAAALAPIAARGVQRWDASLVGEWKASHDRLIGNRQQTCRIVSRVLRVPALTSIVVRALSVCPALSRPVVRSLNRPALLLGARA